MRRSLTAVATSGALTLTLLAAGAAHSEVVHVDGDRFGRGTTEVSHGCNDVTAAPVFPPEHVVGRGPGNPPLGQRSIGWEPQGPEFGAGVVGHVRRPGALKKLQVHVWSPDESTPGRVVATYHAPGDTGVWKGLAPLPTVTTQGWSAVDAADAVYAWTHLTPDGEVDRTDSTFTIQDFVDRQGGNGGGAELGFLFGCDEHLFHLDRLQVRTDQENRVFDLGGYLTRGTVELVGTRRKKLTIIYGQLVEVRVKLRELTGDPVAGTVRLQTRRPDRRRWTKLRSVALGADGVESVLVAPARNGSVRTSYAGDETHEPGAGQPMIRFRVRSNVTDRLRDSRIVVGQRFVLNGRILPKRRAKIALQRYTGSQWRTVKTARSGKDGRYTIGAVSRRAGKSFWRVLAKTGSGNAAGHSVWSRLITEPKPQPQPPGGGGGTNPPPTNPTPPPPEDPPPPPPGPQRASVR